MAKVLLRAQWRTRAPGMKSINRLWDTEVKESWNDMSRSKRLGDELGWILIEKED